MTVKTKKKTPAKKRKAAAKAKRTPAQTLRLLGLFFAGCAVVSAAAFAVLFVDYKALPSHVASISRDFVRGAGLRVDEVQVSGTNRFTYSQITQIARVDMDATMFGQNIADMQTRLEEQTWIERARVTRKLPNVITIVVDEHEPFARWQLNGQVQLVDEGGKPFMAIAANEWRQLPLIVGEGAPNAAAPLANALISHPDLASRLTSATRVGKRRWDLKFRSGAVVKLPEGDIATKLAQLSRMHAQNNLLDSGVMRIDMRMDQMLAISTSPDSAVPARQNQTGRAKAIETAG